MLSLLLLAATGAAPAADRVTILHTNDWQSGLTGVGPDSTYTPMILGDDETQGGVARLAALIETRRAAHAHPVLLLDGGDVTMGTLFHVLTRETGTELQIMARMGYDAVTLGNHEFDFRPGGLGDMIASAQGGVGIPPLVATNLQLDPTDPRDDRLEALLSSGIIARTRVIERGGLSFGIVGILGRDATDVMGDADPVSTSDPVAAARSAAQALRGQGVDAVFVVSHSGVERTEDGAWGGEEVELLRQVPELDAVIGGHSHTALHEPILVDGRPVVQAGSDTQWLGELTLERAGSGAPWTVEAYTLHPVDDAQSGAFAVHEQVEALKDRVDAEVLAPLGYRFDQPLATADRFHGRGLDAHVVGNLVTDAMRAATGADLAVTGNGTVRADIYPGVQAVSDVFRMQSLGIGTLDDSPGYDVIKGYVSGPDLKSALEFLLVGYTLKGDDYYPRLSGVRVSYNPNRVPFDRITRVELGSDAEGWREADLRDADARYSMAATTYVASFLPQVSALSYGILDVTLLDANDQPVAPDDLAAILHDADPNTEGVQPTKSWRAMLDHMRDLPDLDEDGLGDIPSSGPLAQARLVPTPSWSPASLFANATWRMGVVGLLPFGLLAMVGAPLWWLRRRRARSA
jgi:5'-nucleotidase